MPWLDRVNSVLAAWFPGIRGGEAVASLLFGDVNPSGKLPLTFPRSEADVPRPKLAEQPPPRGAEDTAAFFPGAAFKVNSRHFDLEYTEGLKVGYKWYEAENKQPLFPFGYGLSYTTYAYSGLAVTPGERPSVSFTVKNTGARAGEETAQVYVSLPANAGEPFRRLVAWEKVALYPGESKKITLPLDPKFLSIFDADRDAWQVVTGEYKVWAGPSSRDLSLTAALRVP
jgi:beta-glucosidase